MSRYSRHNPEEPIRHDWTAGGRKPEAQVSFAGSLGSAADELATLKAENERLKDIVLKCNRDWYRLKDFIIACNGPGEMIRFKEAAQKNNGKGVEMFLSYLDSLWRELDKAKSHTAEMTDGESEEAL